MSLIEELEKLIPEKKKEQMGQSEQLAKADEIEKTLEKIGVQLQPRFEIPLSTRIRITSKLK